MPEDSSIFLVLRLRGGPCDGQEDPQPQVSLLWFGPILLYSDNDKIQHHYLNRDFISLA